MNPQDRMSTSGCLKEVLNLDLRILNIRNFEVGDLAPTERISTSLILKIVGIKKKIDDSDNDEEAETLILSTQLSDEHVETSTEFAFKATERSRLKHRRSISRRSLALGDNQEEGPVKKKRTLRDLANSADIFHDPLKRCYQENQSEIPPLLASNYTVTLPGQPPRPIHSSSLPADIYDVDNGSTSILFEQYPGYIQMRVGPNTTTIKTSDLWLSGTQILIITGLPRNERDQMLRRINSRMITMGLPFRTIWVSFKQDL
jgi:hypothetical protein